MQRWLILTATILAACTTSAPVSNPPTASAPQSQTTTPPGGPPGSFDGTLHGWRIAPDAVLRSEGLDRHLDLDCTPSETGGDTRTELDFDVQLSGRRLHPESVTKWVCDGQGLSVLQQYSLDGGLIDIERALWNVRASDVDAPQHQVTACDVNATPAICVRKASLPMIIVIEDDTLDPFARVLRVMGDEVSFDVVHRVAASVR